jgi:hypothetical protein
MDCFNKKEFWGFVGQFIWHDDWKFMGGSFGNLMVIYCLIYKIYSRFMTFIAVSKSFFMAV